MSDKVNNLKKLSGISYNSNFDSSFQESENPASKDLFQFENLIAELSVVLIDTSEENLEKELNSLLRKFVEFLEVDRGVVIEYHDDPKSVKVLMQYINPNTNIPPFLETYVLPEKEIDELKKGLTIRAEKIPDDLPEMFRKGLIEKENAESLISVPLYVGRIVIGGLIFICYRKEYKWADDLVSRIKVLGGVFANAILRKRSIDALNREMESRRMLEDKYASIIKNASVGFFMTDHNHNILDVNDEYCRMSGYSHEELIGMRISDIDYSEDPERKVDHDRILAVRSEGGLFHHQTRHIHKSGRIFDVEVNTQYLERERFFFSFLRDVTELNKARKELEERLEFEEVISEFSTALINIKPDDIEKELGKRLVRFVDLIGADRCAVNVYADDKKSLKNLMQYSVPELNVPVPEVRNIPEGEMSELGRGIISAEKIPEDLPQMLKGSFIEKSKAKSLIIVPLLTGNKVFGNLAFSNYGKERKWSDELVRRIKLISEIVGNAILRLRSHEMLLEEMKRRHILEERHSSVITTANVGFMVSDQNANILEVNDAYCEMSGYSRDELLGMKLPQLDMNLDSGILEKENARMLITGSFHHETEHIRKDGSVINVYISANILEKEGMVCCFIRDITDIKTAKKELEERLKFEELTSEFSAALVKVKVEKAKAELDVWFKRFSELLNLDIFTIGEYSDDYSSYRYVCTYINPALIPELPPFPDILSNDENYGVARHLMNGESIKREKPSDQLPEDLTKWKNKILSDGTKSILMLPLIAGDKLLGRMAIGTLTHEQKWSDELVRRLRLIAEICANTLMRDRADQELKKYQNHLERMVEERTEKLEKAQKELVISEKMATLGKLTATVSHELRNPLGTIRSSVYSAQKRLAGQNEKVTKALDRAERNIKRCDLIIEELLNFSRTQDLIRKQTPLNSWIDEVLEENGPPVGIAIEKNYNSNETVNMDQERFRQCIVNILTNAYQAIEEKDVDEPGLVRVQTHRDFDKMMIEISDNGVGFAMENKDKLFEPLYSTKTFGVGLGIPIVKQIIEQHGWAMDMKGKPQKGTTVFITIPFSNSSGVLVDSLSQ